MTETETKKEYNLERDCELRFEIESKLQVIVEVNKKNIKIYEITLIYLFFLAQNGICRTLWNRIGEVKKVHILARR